MNPKFGLFLCLLLALHASCTIQTRMLDPEYYSNSQNVTLYKDSYGFYAYTSFTYGSAASYPMIIGLYTSQTILPTGCLDFNTYYCSYYGCTANPTTSTPILPDFTVLNGNTATANIYLSSGNWQLETTATLASSCSQNTYYSFGYSRYGIIGLGVTGSTANFVNTSSSTFSIYISRSGSSGYLLFRSDTNLISSSSSVGSFSANGDWQVPSSTVMITVGGSSISSTASAIFDLNSDTIGLPMTVYTSLIQDIQSAAGTYCSYTSGYKPICYYSGKLGSLPTIKLTIQGVEFDLPPTLYVVGQTNENTYVSQITLGFRGLSSSSSSSYSDYSYVTPTFSNYVIFGTNFMSYYHPEFSYSNGFRTISLYNLIDSPSSTLVWPFIVGGVLGFIVIVIIVCCCITKRRNKIRAQREAQRFGTDGVNVSDQAPLVTTVQVIPSVTQNYPANYGYQQANSNYGYPQQYTNPDPNQQYQYGGYNNAQAGNYYVPPQGYTDNMQQ